MIDEKALEAACRACWPEMVQPEGRPYDSQRMRRALEAYEAALWRPIEEAPKQGSPTFLIAFGTEGCAIGYWDAYFAEGGYGYRDGFAWIENFSGEPLNLHFSEAPTHYRTLPAPPVKEGE